MTPRVFHSIMNAQHMEVLPGTVRPIQKTHCVTVTYMRISLFCYCILARSRSLYTVASPPVVCLSVTLMRPSQAVEIFGHFFYAVWYPGHPLTSTENFTDIVPGEPLRRGRIKCRMDSQNSDFGPIEGYISKTVQEVS